MSAEEHLQHTLRLQRDVKAIAARRVPPAAGPLIDAILTMVNACVNVAHELVALDPIAPIPFQLKANLVSVTRQVEIVNEISTFEAKLKAPRHPSPSGIMLN